MNTQNIAIIGSGITGSVLAYLMQEKGLNVTVFEKSRGLGGRTSARRYETGSFDHGAPYFSVTNSGFYDFLKNKVPSDLVLEWSGKFIEKNMRTRYIESSNDKKYIFSPSMNSFSKFLLEAVSVQKNTLIEKIISDNQKLSLIDSESNIYQDFDLLISTAPPEQSYALLKDITDKAADIKKAEMESSFSLMLAAEENFDFKFSSLDLLYSDFIEQICCDHKKPAKDDNEIMLTVKTTDSWTKENLERGRDEITESILNEFKKITGFEDIKPKYISLQRWKFSKVKKAIHKPIYDDFAKVAACGDWTQGENGVESAFLAAKTMLETIYT